MNWLDPPVEPPNVPAAQDQEAPSENNLNYWAARLLPLHDPAPGYSTPTPEKAVEMGGEEKEVVFVTCNRVGTEEGTISHQQVKSRGRG
jgi:protein N-terminal amidase